MNHRAASQMRWLRVSHDTTYDYHSQVELAQHIAHLRPRATAWQQIQDWVLLIDPLPDEWHGIYQQSHGQVPPSQMSTDGWGNWRLAFSHSRRHQRLWVRSQFIAGLTGEWTRNPADSPAWEEVARRLGYRAGEVATEAVEFTLPSPYAPCAPALADYARRSFTPGRPLAEAALALMQQIHTDFEYRPQSTHISTRAPEALALRYGVCQDFAHVMIAACRSLGLAARYVSGYLLTQPPPGQPRLVGADASHAWVAVWCPLQGWIALDPTNRIPAGLDHVTLAWGRDYGDVAPLRGVIRGGGQTLPAVAVTVEPLLAPPLMF